MLSYFLQVWSFNDFMDQYNQIYAWLNNIQVGTLIIVTFIFKFYFTLSYEILKDKTININWLKTKNIPFCRVKVSKVYNPTIEN